MLKKDIKILKGVSETKYKFAQVFLIFFFLLQLFVTYNNVSLAINYGQAMGLSFAEILDMWNTEPNLQKLYSGYEVQTIHRLNMAILSFCASLLILMTTAFVSFDRLLKKRILSTLEQCGAIKH